MPIYTVQITTPEGVPVDVLNEHVHIHTFYARAHTAKKVCDYLQSSRAR